MNKNLFFSLLLAVLSCSETPDKASENSQNPVVFNNRDKMFQTLVLHYEQRNWKAFKNISEVLIEDAENAKDTKNLAKAYRYLGAYYKSIAVYDSAYLYYTKAERQYRTVKDEASLINVLLNKSVVQYYAGDYVGADRTITEAYLPVSRSKDFDRMYEINTMMGLIANELREYERGIDYNLKALSIVRNNKLEGRYQEATCLNNIGYAYLKLENYEKAINYFESGLRSTTISKDQPALYSLLLDNLAYARFKSGNDKDLPRLFFEALKVRKENSENSLIVLSYIHLSEFFADRDNQKSKDYADTALFVARKNKNPIDISSALKNLSAVDGEKSAKYSSELIRINDSLRGVEVKSQEKFARLELQTDEISQEKDKLAEQNRNLLYFFVGFLMIGLLLFVIRSQRARNRELLLIQAQQKANEDIYNLMISQQNRIEESRIREKRRIAQELHDGVLGRLFGTRLNLDSLNRMGDDEAVMRRIEYLNELKNIEQDIREISHDLNREKFALINNFLAILNNLLEEQKASFNTQVTCEIDETIDWDNLSNTIKINIYRIVQEGLQNMNKYAQASKVKISIKSTPGGLALVIADNGIGFDTSLKRKGIGVQNMISRANEMRGELNIQSKKGKGTTLSVDIPIT